VGVALDTTGDEVAIGILAEFDLGNDVIEALHGGVEAAQTVEAKAAVAGVDGLAERRDAEEIEIVDIAGGGEPTVIAALRKREANLVGKEHLDDVTGFVSLDQAESTAVEETAEGGTSGADRYANASGEPGHGEQEPAFPFQAGVTEKEGVDGAVEDIQSEIGDNEIVELFPDPCGVGFVVGHGGGIQ